MGTAIVLAVVGWLMMNFWFGSPKIWAFQDAARQATAQAQVRFLRATVLGQNSVRLQWRPIDFQSGSGRYEIGLALPREADDPVQPIGVVNDLAADGFLVEGLEPGTIYRFQVRAVIQTEDGERTGTFAFTYATTAAAAEDLTLLLIYFPADNDLSPYVDNVLQRVARGSQANPNVYTLVLVDRWGPDNTVLYEVRDGLITPTDAVEQEWGVLELDTTDPAVLSWFLNYGQNQISAERTAVSLMGHGTGLMPHVAELPELPVSHLPPVSQDGIPALPRGIEATPGDFNDGGAYMSTVALGRALAEATEQGAAPFDLLFFDQCFQGNLDVLYEVYPYARVLIASPNYAWLSAPYHYYLPAMAPGVSPELMARVIVGAYQRSLNNAHPNAIFWLPGMLIPEIAQAVDAMALSLEAALADGQDHTILEAAEAAQYVDTTQCGPGLYELGPPDEMLGINSFALQLGMRFGRDDAYGVGSAAQRLRATLRDVQTSSRIGRPYLKFTAFWDYTDSLTILAPLALDTPVETAWRTGIYTRTLPLEASWPVEPDTVLTITDTPRYIAEGRWADFIAAWYPEPRPALLGEICLYTPPAEIDADAEEELTLAVEPSELSNEVILTWSQATLADGDSYLLFARQPPQNRPRLIAVVPPDQTTLKVQLPPGEVYQFQVRAQDELGLNFARSNIVLFELNPQTSPGEMLYLPALNLPPAAR